MSIDDRRWLETMYGLRLTTTAKVTELAGWLRELEVGPGPSRSDWTEQFSSAGAHSTEQR
ncbi:hypothetical protein OG225_42730 (plasmid) [Nocardia sp. NBC_01377]|uniref:hypothetical protein n=1 Tax=Nocardia sp. NBC_01377 TaxID=2903595 RepID=UPI00325094F0